MRTVSCLLFLFQHVTAFTLPRVVHFQDGFFGAGLARGRPVALSCNKPALSLQMCSRSLESFRHEGVTFLRLGIAQNSTQIADGQTTSRPIQNEHFAWVGSQPRTPRGMEWFSRSENQRDDKQATSNISEVVLFCIGSVLLPGSSFPLQIFKHKDETQRMFRQLGKGGSFGVVLSVDRIPGSFAGVGCEAYVKAMTSLDDGRLILECTGTRRFRILEVVQEEPYPIAVVEWIEDKSQPQEVSEMEIECWKTVQQVVWLCVEVWDKRAWVPLLMGEGDKHPLHALREAAPGGNASAVYATDAQRREAFSWHMVRLLRNGIPGLWEHELTDSVIRVTGIQKLLETTDVGVRFDTSLRVLRSARDVLRLRQRLKDLSERREEREAEGGSGGSEGSRS